MDRRIHRLMTPSERVSDDSVFSKLFSDYQRRSLYGFFHRAGLPRRVAEDCAEDVFTRILATMGTKSEYDPAKGSIKTWTYCIAANVLFNYQRSQRSHKVFLDSELFETDDADLEGFGATIPDTNPPVIEQTIRGEHLNHIHSLMEECLPTLTEPQRLVVILWEGTAKRPMLGDLATLREVRVALTGTPYTGLSLSTLHRLADAAWEKMGHFFSRKVTEDEALGEWVSNLQDNPILLD